MKIETLENSVTISLDKYEEMKAEIERLKKEVAQKTIYKEVHPKWFQVATLILIGILSLALLFNIGHIL